MVDEQLEFAVSQFADGTLPASQHDALKAHLAADPALVALLEEYRALAPALRAASPVPSFNWDRLSTHISDVIGESENRSERSRTFTMPWVRRAASLAVAASIAVAIGIGLQHRSKPSAPNISPSEISVAGPMEDAPAGAVVRQITVGPSAAIAMDDSTWRYGDSDVVQRPSRVVIASSDAPVQDTPATPY